MNKLKRLEMLIADCRSLCVAYSGGVDSAFLAVVAHDVLGPEKTLAVTGRSASYPDVQWSNARSIAQQFGLPHIEIATDEMRDPNYLANPTNRCYFCKSELWSKLKIIAARHQLAVIADGSNADDAHDHRPGARAAREHLIRSPLQEAGLTKSEIRVLSRARGLPTWDQPASPCLSSRLPYGLAVTPERLRQVEAAEQIVREAGVREFRVRHHGDVARLEVAAEEQADILEAARTITARLKALGFRRVVLDVEGYRRGSLNERNLVQLQTRSAANPAVVAAGYTSDIAIVDADIDAARVSAHEIRKAGFRFIAIELPGQPSRTRT